MTKELREAITNCFKRTKMQTEGDTELFDTELTIDELVDLFDRYAAEREKQAFSEGYEAGLRRGETETKLKIAKGELSVSLKETTNE